MIQYIKIIPLFLWFALLAAICHLPAATAFGAPENHAWEIFSIGYDAPNCADVAYDGPEKSSSAYDVAPSRAQTYSERRSVAQSASFALLGRLLAAKTGVTATQPNRIYSARELIRRADEPGPFHKTNSQANQQR